MRKKILLVAALMIAGTSLAGCYGHPGHDSDWHHHHHHGHDHGGPGWH